MFVHTHSSAPNMFAKFGWKTQKFCHKKIEKAVARLESDRLYRISICIYMYIHVPHCVVAAGSPG